MTTTTRTRSTGRAPQVEPKLQARRIEVARDRGRRRLRIVLVVAVLVVVLVGLGALTRSPALDVDQVQVRGVPAAQRDDVREAAAVAAGTPMLSVDAAGAEDRLEALPWVASASIARSWPGTVVVTVAPRRPIALVGEGSDAVQVDATGRAIRPARPGSALPVVGGPAIEVGQVVAPGRRAVVHVLAGLPDELRAEVASAHASPSGTVLELTDGIRVRWGDTGLPTAKADALAVLLEQADRQTIATIDVSVPRAAALTRRGGAS